MEWYERVRMYRRARNMSQQTLAEKLGYLDKSSIARIEKGEADIPHSKTIALAKALSISPALLITGKEPDEDQELIRAFHAAEPSIQLAIKSLLHLA